MEAHGTGTDLGDPIEIAGLTQAFRQVSGMAHSGDRQFCRIGSVKSNIGHLESAAGIAVIGLAGRYPQANTLDEFWENLRTGRDCIIEVPDERWEHSRYFDPDKHKPGKTYSKWGGFLDDVDRFDPLFFNIPSRDAELMDPPERLFLECVWHLLEDANHTREFLRAHYQAKIGVYVGAMSQQYHAFDADLIKESAVALSSYYSIANRVSSVFDLQGPSMAIDTACSSATSGPADARPQVGVAPGVTVTMPAAMDDSPQIVALSARSWDRLRAVAGHMLAFVPQRPDCSRADLA